VFDAHRNWIQVEQAKGMSTIPLVKDILQKNLGIPNDEGFVEVKLSNGNEIEIEVDWNESVLK